MRIRWILLLSMIITQQVSAQYFQFSQYNFTKQRINPAVVGLSDYASVSLDYRHQPTAGGFTLNSSFLDASYPLISKKKIRWAGIGLTFMDDRSGQGALFRTQEAAVSFAGNIRLAKFHTLSLGTKVLYQSRNLDLGGLYTGSQYIPDRGFDGSVSSGETSNTLKTNYVSLNFGLHWQRVNKKGNRTAYTSFSFFDFNKPQEDFLVASKLHETWVGAAGVRVYSKDKVSLIPEILFTQSSSTSLFNVGLVTQYDLQRSGKYQDHINILTRYVPSRSAIVGIQLHKENFSVGISYDFPVAKDNVVNQGAIEIGIELRRLVKRSKLPSDRKSPIAKPAKQEPKQKLLIVKDSIQLPVPQEVPKGSEKNKVSERLKHKQDSVDALASAGKIKHEPLILETAVFHFNFEFNSAELDESSLKYVEDLALALLDNPKLKVIIIGHTDNVGSDKFNLKLSLYRAGALKDVLIERGIEPECIRVDGKGMREPLNANKTEADRAFNRRVVLTILYD